MEKVKESLWKNLQKHLKVIYEFEKSFDECLFFTSTYPFKLTDFSAGQLEDYWLNRSNLRNLFIDEVQQLNVLIKAIRGKSYIEDEKKQLFMLILGYVDIVSCVNLKLSEFIPERMDKDDELEKAQSDFQRLQKFIRLNIKGVFTF